MLRATPVIKPETAESTGYVVVVAVVVELMTPDRDATIDDDNDDDDDDEVALMVNKDKIFANDLEVARLDRLK